MKNYLKKPFFLWQLSFLILSLIDYLICINSGINSLVVFLTVFILLAWPGLALRHFLKLDFKNFFDNLVLILATGLILALTTSFFGIIIGLNIQSLTLVYSIVVVLIILAGIIYQIVKPSDEKVDFKGFWMNQDLLTWLVFAVTIGLLIVASITGGLFRGGDPSYHLSILRKVYEGLSLTPLNLGFTKSSSIHIAYGAPVWHVFMGILTKFLQTDIFTLYGRLVVPLTAGMVLIWWRLLRQILPSRFLANVSTLLLIVFYFLSLFTPLGLPDALNQYVLLPLALFLALKFVFNLRTDWRLLGLLTLFLIMMAAIHLTQYFYFLIIMAFFLAFWVFSQWGKNDSKQISWRIFYAIISVLVLFLPLAALLELKAKMISEILKANLAEPYQTLRYGNFNHFQIMVKFSYLLAPFLLLLVKPKKIFWFSVSLFTIIPILYWSPIAHFLQSSLGYIFVNRLYGNVSWHFLIIGLLVGAIVLGTDMLIKKLPGFVRILVALILVGLNIWAIYLQLKFSTFANLYRQVFSKEVGIWLTQNLWWLLIGIAILVIIGLLIEIKGKKIPEFINHEPANKIVAGLLTFFIVFWFFSPKLYIATDTFDPIKRAEKVFKPESIVEMAGGKETIDYIKNNIPAKSVFATNGRDVYLTMLLDQFMAAYPHSAGETKSKKLFEANTSIEDKIKFIKSTKLQYLLVINAKPQTVFDSFPQYFTKIYDHGNKIYQISGI